MFSFCLKNPSDDDDNFAVEFQTEIATENCGYNFCSPETATHPPLNMSSSSSYPPLWSNKNNSSMLAEVRYYIISYSMQSEESYLS